MDYSKVTAGQWAALREVKRQEGRRWKAALSDMWERANYPGYSQEVGSHLQYLRNASYFGPTGLDRLRPAQMKETAS